MVLSWAGKRQYRAPGEPEENPVCTCSPRGDLWGTMPSLAKDTRKKEAVQGKYFVVAISSKQTRGQFCGMKTSRKINVERPLVTGKA